MRKQRPSDCRRNEKHLAYMMLLVLVFLLSDVSLQAQVAGTISGFVRDQTGALIPGAEVTAEMVDRPVARTAVTGATICLRCPPESITSKRKCLDLRPRSMSASS